MNADIRILAAALKDIINAADNGKPYTAEELTGPLFAPAVEIMSKLDEEAPL